MWILDSNDNFKTVNSSAFMRPRSYIPDPFYIAKTKTSPSTSPNTSEPNTSDVQPCLERIRLYQESVNTFKIKIFAPADTLEKLEKTLTENQLNNLKSKHKKDEGYSLRFRGTNYEVQKAINIIATKFDKSIPLETAQEMANHMTMNVDTSKNIKAARALTARPLRHLAFSQTLFPSANHNATSLAEIASIAAGQNTPPTPTITTQLIPTGAFTPNQLPQWGLAMVVQDNNSNNAPANGDADMMMVDNTDSSDDSDSTNGSQHDHKKIKLDK